MTQPPLMLLYLGNAGDVPARIKETLVGSGIDCELVVAPPSGDAPPPAAAKAALIFVAPDGEPLLATLRRQYPATPLICVTPPIGEEAAVDLIRHGATDLVLDGRLERLAPAVTRALGTAVTAPPPAEGPAAEEGQPRLQQELEALQDEFKAFCHSVSHDLRAPLTIIDGFSKAVLEDCAEQLDDQGRTYLERIRVASTRMTRLIDALLTLSRLNRAPFHPEPTDISAMARTIEQELRYLHPERTVTVSIADHLTALADRRQLRTVIEQLLKNAWKFSEKRTTAQIEVGATPREGTTVFFVRDNGVGFNMAYADNLFAPFQRMHRAEEFPGDGIGLALVQRIVHRHGGRIWAEAEVDKGATFYFTLQ